VPVKSDARIISAFADKADDNATTAKVAWNSFFNTITPKLLVNFYA
jgi:hypothetical protein